MHRGLCAECCTHGAEESSRAAKEELPLARRALSAGSSRSPVRNVCLKLAWLPSQASFTAPAGRESATGL